MKFQYRVHYGAHTSSKDFVSWKEACDFMKHLLNEDWPRIRVEKI